MNHWIVIPFRGPEYAKTRLCEAMSDKAREALARTMFQHVLAISCAVAGKERVLVVTPSPTAARIAAASGAMVLREHATDLNGALHEARSRLRQLGGSTFAAIAADLPMLRHDDVAELADLARPGRMVIAIDRKRSGTNVLALPVGADFDFKFGHDSALAHSAEARYRRLETRSLRNDGLVCDVDLPADLELLSRPHALSALPTLSAGALRGMQ